MQTNHPVKNCKRGKKYNILNYTKKIHEAHNVGRISAGKSEKR
jgi:hypothetical protein